MQHITLSIHMRWWLKPYLWGVSLMAALTHAEPDMAKVERAIRHGLVVKVVPVVFGVEA